MKTNLRLFWYSTLLALFFLAAGTGCKYEGPVSAIPCEGDEDCPAQTFCVQGYCAVDDLDDAGDLTDTTGGGGEDTGGEDTGGEDTGGDTGGNNGNGDDVEEDPCPGLTQCGQQCVDLQQDFNHCGQCNNSCPSEICDQGQCAPVPCDPESSPFGGGDGTEDDPYTICHVNQLNRIGGDDTYLHDHFILAADLDLDDLDPQETFTPIGDPTTPFMGVFDGDNREIRNLHVDFDGNYAAMFRQVGSNDEMVGSVTRVRLIDVDISGGVAVGGLVGRSFGTVSNSHVSGSVHGDTASGILVGINFGIISSSTTEGMLYATTAEAGGLVGRQRQNGIITDSHADVELRGTASFTGGLLGRGMEYSAVTGSSAAGSVSMTNASGVGGLVGLLGDNSSAYDSTASGKVNVSGTNHDNVGGLVGQMHEETSIEYSHATGDVMANSRVGGLVGLSYGTIKNSSASGSAVAINGYVGGLVGYNLEESGDFDACQIQESHASGSVVSANGDHAGGLVGYHSGDCEIYRSSATGDVLAFDEEYVGGLVGRLDGGARIVESFAAGSVRGRRYIGGLVGRIHNDSGTEVRDSYAIGAVHGNDDIGGLVGHNRRQVTRCYSIGRVTGDGDGNGLIGDSNDDVEDSYWNITTSGQSNSNAGQGLTASQFMDPSNFENWQFGTIWEMSLGQGRPVLRWE